MTGPLRITRTELVWPGKYDEDGGLARVSRPALPLQVVETFRPAPESGGWQNKLVWGDNLLVMSSLLKEFAGTIDLIYIDPPFATGSDFSFTSPVGVAAQAYRDTWKPGAYLAMMAERLRLIRELLSPQGSFFLHCDWHVGHLLRAVADEVFGGENFLNEIVWYYYNKFQGNVKRFASNHDVVFWYRKGPAYQFKPQVEKRKEGKVKQLVRQWDKEKAAIVNAKGPDGRVMYRETDERTVDDVWRISMLQPADRTENCGYPTQKPEALLQRIVEAASSEGDLVADFFCGSGTLLAVAEKLNRRWIGCDLGRWSIHATRKRLMGFEQGRPFALLSLGKHERRHWQGAIGEYVPFMLQLYGAQPVAGLAHSDGSKGGALVRIGAVDAPVTTAEIDDAVEECAGLMVRELHFLGWEWRIERCDRMIAAARCKGVDLLLLQIPPEVMEQPVAASVRFFPLTWFDAQVEQPASLAARVALTRFVVPSGNERSGLGDWSDYVDYWGVDWDFRGEVFSQGWAAYRTRRQGEISLVSGDHLYETPGKRQILVRVIDIFGNDTKQAFDVDVG